MRRTSGDALPSRCGAYVYGPVHLRRGAHVPEGAADREVCRACSAGTGVVAAGALPATPIAWPTAEPVAGGRHRWRHRIPCTRRRT
ncbi:hypothetical protein [Saccharopolyspora sp. MS10]|uniref:hypothetical protein n=1 Tax=Saccharopolyspora sp. MS10 TaxID=3385973 RepID=UPI0039A38A33